MSAFSNGEIPLSDYCTILRSLFAQHHTQHRAYLFVDELVFSKLDAKDDEVKVRAAMVRDIFRTSRTMNNFFVQNDMDFHIIASVRPEIRDMINDQDTEIGKIFDGKSVLLSWDMGEESDSLLFRLLKQKVIHSKGFSDQVVFSEFMDDRISFGQKSYSLEEFIKNNTWSRPRDIVQLLNSIAFKSPNSPRMGEKEIKHALNEFSRRSFFEIMDEISVRHGALIGTILRENIKRQKYSKYDDFYSDVLNKFGFVDKDQLLEDLFQSGVIGNSAQGRFYWAHRGEEFFDKSQSVSIHAGLWNYFNIR